MRLIPTQAFGLAALFAAASPEAGNFVTSPRMTLDLAEDIARAAVDACRADGWQVTAVVVDRSGIPQVMLRDLNASRFTIQIATEKANAVILSGVTSAEFRKNRDDIRQEMNHVEGILVLEGGVPIRAAGTLVGAVGVSGAPGGDKDEACALKALETVRERLEFAD
jgi:uncharacterized protein GlcG (DUF336 family)